MPDCKQVLIVSNQFSDSIDCEGAFPDEFCIFKAESDGGIHIGDTMSLDVPPEPLNVFSGVTELQLDEQVRKTKTMSVLLTTTGLVCVADLFMGGAMELCLWFRYSAS